MEEKLVGVSGEYTIDSIIKNLYLINETKSKICFYGELDNYNFKLNEPATKEEISFLQKHFKYNMPTDFVEFLSKTNGLDLSIDSRLCDIEEILDFKDAMPYPDNIMVIGACFCSDVHIVIDLQKEQNNCMFVTEPIGCKYAYGLNCSFTDFLSRYVSCYGADFWNWGADYSNKVSTEEVWCDEE